MTTQVLDDKLTPFGKQLAKLCIDENISKSDLAKRCSFSYQYLLKIMSGKVQPTVQHISEIEVALAGRSDGYYRRLLLSASAFDVTSCTISTESMSPAKIAVLVELHQKLAHMSDRQAEMLSEKMLGYGYPNLKTKVTKPQ